MRIMQAANNPDGSPDGGVPALFQSKFINNEINSNQNSGGLNFLSVKNKDGLIQNGSFSREVNNYYGLGLVTIG